VLTPSSNAPGGPTSMQEALENVQAAGGRIGVVAWYAGPVQMDIESRGPGANVRILRSTEERVG